MWPNLIIIGAMKSGTSSLRWYLDQHPDIAMAPGGLNFFIAERNWGRGAAWYQEHFAGPQRIQGDCSPRYANYPIHRDVPERMAALVPRARLLYLVRDPIERLVSHYLHNTAHGSEARGLADALEALEGNEYVERGRYFAQLERFLPYYRDALLILFHEDLRDRRLATLRRVFEFLDVEPSFASDRFAVERHRTADKFPRPVARPRLPAALGRRLADLYRPDLSRLGELTGRDLRHWCAA